MKKCNGVIKTTISALIIAAYIAMIIVLVVQALIPGEESATISDSFGDKINQVVTDIQKPVAERVDVVRVEINSILVDGDNLRGDEINMTLGSQGRIRASVYPSNATNSALTYSSSDESILRVYSDGRVVCRSIGTVQVMVASIENPSLTASVVINVVSVSLEAIEIHNPTSDIRVGDNFNLELEFYPMESNEREVIWHTSDPSVLEVDDDGVFNARDAGVVTVYATSLKNSEISAEVTITILPQKEDAIIPTEIIVVSPESSYKVGSTVQLTANLYPAGADGNVIWYSSDQSIATVNQDGKVKFHSSGTAEIIARCGDVESRIEVTAKEVVSENIHLSFRGINLFYGVHTMKQGTSGRVIATLDKDATVLDITFTSANEHVAKISSDGAIEALQAGITIITVSTTCEDEITSVSFELVVNPITFEDTIDDFYTRIRKGMGHFGAFLVLGILASLSYYIIFKKSLLGKLCAFIICLFAGFAVAGITEILQLPIFTVGRGASFSDVMLDFTGYCTSVAPIYMIIFSVHFVEIILSKIKCIFNKSIENDKICKL